MRKFEIGDKVRIAETSEYYVDNDDHNPKGSEGKVIGVVDEIIVDDLVVHVDWGDKKLNHYAHRDLVPITEVTSSTVFEEICNKTVLAGYISTIQELCHGLAKEAGWWEGRDISDPLACGAVYALIHSELSEGLEGMRKDLMDDHLLYRKMEEVELADAIIRILDYAGAKDLDVGGALIEKLEYNRNRADHKPENRAKEGGKKI